MATRPKSQQQKKLLGGSIIVLLVGALVLHLLFYPRIIFTELENRTWDWRVHLTASPGKADPRIKIIVVDQDSLDFFDQTYQLTWPLPRNAYAHVISFLTASKARGVAFDMLFTESSAQSVEGDQEFATAAGGTLPVISAVSLEQHRKYTSPEKVAAFRARQRGLAEKQEWSKFYGKPSETEFHSVTLPIPELMEKTRALGSVHAVPDSDGIFRRHLPLAAFESIQIPGLPEAMWESTVPDRRSIDDLKDKFGQLIVRLYGGKVQFKSAYEMIPFAAVLQADAARAEAMCASLPLSTFEHSWVFVGVTAPGLLDLRPTSLDPLGNGVQFLAATFDNLLHHDFVRTLSTAESAGLTLIVIILATCASLVGSTRTHGIAFLIIGLTCAVLAYATAARGVWIPVIMPLFGVCLAGFLGLGLQYYLEGRQLRFLRHAFQHYVSPSLVEQIVENPSQLSLGGEKRALTIFFSDIVNFTNLSERMDARALAELLNDYLSLIADIIQERGGTVDKFVGDAVVAFWSAPLFVKHHESLALKTAIDCQQALRDRADHYQDLYGVTIRTRIGLHADLVNVGNFGSRTRFNYTVIGDGANLASRLEGANKMFGTEILFSETVELALRYQIGQEIGYRCVGEIRVVGRAQPVRVFEPKIGTDQSAFLPQNLSRYNEALRLFQEGELIESKSIFESLDGDPVAAAYIARIDSTLESGTIEKSAWTPMWTMTEK